MAEKSTEKKSFLKKIFASLKSFFKGLKVEGKKIAWPNREQTLKQTAAVVIISAVLCAVIRLIDVLAQLLVGALSSI